jgi:hypothetical protein
MQTPAGNSPRTGRTQRADGSNRACYARKRACWDELRASTAKINSLLRKEQINLFANNGISCETNLRVVGAGLCVVRRQAFHERGPKLDARRVTAGFWRAGAVRFPRHVPYTQHALGARVLRPRCSTGREVIPRGERRRRPGTWGQGPALWHICSTSISHSESGTISALCGKRNSPLFACLRNGIAIAPRQSAAAHADSRKPCRKGNALALTRAPCLLPMHCKGRRMLGQQSPNGNDKKKQRLLYCYLAMRAWETRVTIHLRTYRSVRPCPRAPQERERERRLAFFLVFGGEGSHKRHNIIHFTLAVPIPIQRSNVPWIFAGGPDKFNDERISLCSQS